MTGVLLSITAFLDLWERRCPGRSGLINLGPWRSRLSTVSPWLESLAMAGGGAFGGEPISKTKRRSRQGVVGALHPSGSAQLVA